MTKQNQNSIKPSNQIEWLTDIFAQDEQIPAPKDVEKIKLSKLISNLGFAYEKFRNAIDYNEEHLVRRNSIERFLRRQILFLHEKNANKISKTLIYEFIRAKYLPNDTLPETLITEVGTIIKKYLDILYYINGHKIPDYKKFADWMIAMASCEIDEQLSPAPKEKALINFMYSQMVDDLSFVKIQMDSKEKNLQIYIAVLRTFSKADSNMLKYRLLELYYPNWTKFNERDIHHFNRNIYAAKNKIDKHIGHPLGFQLARIIRAQSVFFTILREVMLDNKKYLRQTLHNPELLEEKIEEICLIKYHSIRRKLVGSIIRAIIYILLTKSILAFALELPYDHYIAKDINWRALGINIGFHPLLMFFVAMTIRVPNVKNTEIIVREIKKIVYGQERSLVFKPKRIIKTKSISFIIFNIIYLAMFAISFGLIIYGLMFLNFNILSGLLFIFFLTLVSFFGFRLRALATQYSVIPRKDNLVNFLFDFITLPIIKAGKFFSNNFSKVNIFIYFFDFIIETPFKALIEFLEKTVSFIGEKREEIIE